METIEKGESNQDQANEHNESGEDEIDNNKKKIKDDRYAKRQQVHYTTKQRIDIYAFCVLELELISSKHSWQQAIQKALISNPMSKQLKRGRPKKFNPEMILNNSPDKQMKTVSLLTKPIDKQVVQDQVNCRAQQQSGDPKSDSMIEGKINDIPGSNINTQVNASSLINQNLKTNTSNIVMIKDSNDAAPKAYLIVKKLDSSSNNEPNINSLEPKSVLKPGTNARTYSDFQKNQVLSSSILGEVQARFAKYYPDSPIPTRTTIKHVFSKCVSHGTVENLKNPRKCTKITKKDELEELLINEPHLSLRQLAQKLNCSKGTISRRCKDLGLVLQTVTLKHQQLAISKNQKQMKVQKQQGLARNSQIQTNATTPSRTVLQKKKAGN